MADLDFSDSTVTRAQEKVTIRQQLHAVDALGEEIVSWADTLEEPALEVDLDDISGQSAHVCALVIGSNHDALIDSLDLAHGQVLEQNLLLRVVNVPDTDAIVVDSDQFFICIVIESDLIGDVHANIVPTDCFSAFSLILKDEEIAEVSDD